MVLSKTMTIDGPQRSHIMELPTELHIRIRDQLLRDPYVTVHDLRPLRLVCKTFNDIWSPVVMTEMVLFRTGLTGDALAQLCHLVHGKSNVSTLSGYTTLTVQRLYCVDTEGDRWYSHGRRLCEQGIIAVFMRMTGMLITTLFWFIALVLLLIYSALTVYPIFLGILRLPMLLVDAISNIRRAIPKFQARYYMALLPRKLNMRNIHCVRLFFDYDCSDWAIYRSTRILLSLPHITELQLSFADTTDLGYLVRCLKPLKGPHKLTLLPEMVTPSQFQCIAALISNNENLTHIDWRPVVSPDISTLFCGVPTTKPLKLQHLSLSCRTTNYNAIIPHIRSLTSVEFRSEGRNRWCIAFSRAKIFPPTIKVGLLDQELIAFLSGHPGLVSFTIVHRSWTSSEIKLVPSLRKILMHHSETLQRILFSYPLLFWIFYKDEGEKFLQSTGNLREFVLELKDDQYDPDGHRVQQVLSVVAHAKRPLTVVIRTTVTIFFRCVALCRNSESPFIRDLARRIVYEGCEDEG